jgi:hypothetical protein
MYKKNMASVTYLKTLQKKVGHHAAPERDE